MPDLHRRTLVLRADASPAIGTGHVMRCLALAQAWQDAGGEATLAWSELPPALLARLHDEGVATHELGAAPASRPEAEETARLAVARDATWVVVDGYPFHPGYLQHLRDRGLAILGLDDMAHLARYPVDLLLNQNLSATPALYRGKIDAEAGLLLGPRYSLLRREFRAVTPIRSPIEGRPRRVLVSCGGGDAENLTARMLRRLALTPGAACEVLVLIGAANPHAADLQALVRELPFRCELRIDVRNVAEAMAWADVAISAGGSTVWELASLRLPALIGAIEQNQLAGMAALRRVPFFRVGRFSELLGWDLGAEIERVLRQPRPDSAAIDAHGAGRVVEAMHRAAAARPATTPA